MGMLKNSLLFVRAVLQRAFADYRTVQFWIWIGAEVAMTALATVALAWLGDWAETAWVDALAFAWRFLLLFVGTTVLTVVFTVPYRIWKAQREELAELSRRLYFRSKVRVENQVVPHFFFERQRDTHSLFLPRVFLINRSNRKALVDIHLLSHVRGGYPDDEGSSANLIRASRDEWPDEDIKLPLLKFPVELEPHGGHALGYALFKPEPDEGEYFRSLFRAKTLFVPIQVEIEETISGWREVETWSVQGPIARLPVPRSLDAEDSSTQSDEQVAYRPWDSR